MPWRYDPSMAQEPPDFPQPRRSRGGARGDRPRRDGDVLAGPADSTRPQNPWPRLVAFALGVIGVVALAGLCVASFASPPDREMRVRDTEYEPGLPKFLAIPTFGADPDGRTYGAYLVVADAALSNSSAFFSRSPETGCNLRWDAGARYQGGVGLFVDPCSDGRYLRNGSALHQDAGADLHEFGVRREANSYVVSFERLTLGECRGDNRDACSPEDDPQVRDTPSGTLPDAFGRE